MGNTLYYGDNLDVLRRYVKDETVDLVYLDPPFNSNWSCPVSVDSLRLESVGEVEGPKAPAGCGAEPRSPSAYVGSSGGRFHPPFVVDG